jgi:hypothetical protein
MTRWRALLAALLGVVVVSTVVGLLLRSGRDTAPAAPAGAAGPAADATDQASVPARSGSAAASPPPTTSPPPNQPGDAGAPAGAADDPLCQARAEYDRTYLEAWRRYGARDYRSVLRVSLPVKLAYYEKARRLVTGVEQEAYRRLASYQAAENFAYQRFGWDPRAPARDPVSWPKSPIEAHRVVNALMRTRCGLTPSREPGTTGG